MLTLTIRIKDKTLKNLKIKSSLNNHPLLLHRHLRHKAYRPHTHLFPPAMFCRHFQTILHHHQPYPTTPNEALGG